MTRRLVVLTVTLALLVTAAWGAVHYRRHVYEGLTSLHQEHQLHLASQAARGITSSLRYSSGLARNVSPSVSSLPRARPGLPATFSECVQCIGGDYTTGMFLSDARGKIVYSTPEAFPDTSCAQRDFFAWARQAGSAGQVFLAPLDHRADRDERPSPPHLVLVTPLYEALPSVEGSDPHPMFVGILAIVVDLQKLVAAQSTAVAEQPGEYTAWILDEAGTLLFHSKHPEMVGRNIHEPAAKCLPCHRSFDYAATIAARETGTTTYSIESGKKRLAAFAPILFANVRWVVVVTSREAPAVAFFEKELNDLVLLVAALVLVLALVLGAVFVIGHERALMQIRERLRHAEERHTLARNAQVSAERYQTIVETAHDIIWTMDRDGLLTFINQRGSEATGYDMAEWIGSSLDPLIASEDLPEHQRVVDATLSGETASYEVTICHKSGTPIRVSVDTLPIREDGAIVGSLSIARDITESSRAAEALRNAESKYRSLVQNAVYGIFRCSMEGAFLDANPAVVRMLGYDSAEDLKAIKVVTDLYHDPGALDRLVELCLGSESVVGFEVEWKRKDGTPVLVRLSGRVERGEKGAPRAIEVITEDISQRHLLEAQLRQAQKMEAVGRLAGGVAHDYNNILTVILGYCQLLLRRANLDATIQSNIEDINNAAGRAASLTRQLLTFSRQQVVRPRVFDLDTVIADMEKMLRRLIGEDVELQVHLKSTGGNLNGDPGQLEQILMNLVINARDAMPQGGMLILETANLDIGESDVRSWPGLPPGSYVALSVSDTGTGMDVATRARIFEPFFTTKEIGKGTGLGLATVFGIVKQWEGDIHVYSEPGEGTTFKIYLPRVSGASVPDLGPDIAEECPRGTETILLVEDEVSVRDLTREVLESLGYKVLVAQHGPEALSLLGHDQGSIDLLLTDVVMPHMNGPELVQRARRDRPAMHVLYMSGYAEQTVLRQVVMDSQAGFLQKPFGQHSLAQMVREVLTTRLKPAA